MFKKIFLSISLFILFIPVQLIAQADPLPKMKAAFIRNDDLWIKTGNREQRITNGEYIRYPKWSHDGNWIAYLKSRKSSFRNGELWLYNLKMEKHFMVKEGVTNNFQWAPGQNKMGFLVNQELFVLNTEPPKHFLVTQLTKEITNFSWLPDISGFLTSAKENRQLNSDIILSKILLRSDRQKPVFKHFYTVPVGENEIVVGSSQFIWSHDHKWISFILNPSASISADSNILCLVSDDGKYFQRVDEVLDYPEWLQWAPTKSYLGYIGGFGREANINKQLKLVSVPSFQNEIFTPKGYVDRDLYWKNDSTIYVSRSKEMKQADLDKRPLPSLYEIDISTFRNKQITNPAKHEGDFAPQFFHSQLLWVRTDTQTANIFVTRTDNMKEIAWITNLTVASAYYAKWNWEEVFSLYIGLEC
ncbi:PD40 domain-containing protein [Neobacillus vireti]|uniref:TolB domain protein n=2 Tax=Neobacillus TaxID=2675232 RepID=A0AB94IUD0_9BACI|nr:PD40 domain-containing protein [Neobacillus vireti]ETI70675.1 tolB domain protein [Neobacillus vireti LMG 21834]